MSFYVPPKIRIPSHVRLLDRVVKSFITLLILCVPFELQSDKLNFSRLPSSFPNSSRRETPYGFYWHGPIPTFPSTTFLLGFTSFVVTGPGLRLVRPEEVPWRSWEKDPRTRTRGVLRIPPDTSCSKYSPLSLVLTLSPPTERLCKEREEWEQKG